MINKKDKYILQVKSKLKPFKLYLLFYFDTNNLIGLGTPLSPPWPYFIEVLYAVGFLHENNILYRDIKPENILLDVNGHAKVADFGLARPGMGEEDEAYSFCGSPEYMAPEMLK